MSVENIDVTLRDEIRAIVADIVEIDVNRIGWNSHFWNELEADSLQGIEILSALERKFSITLDQAALSLMQDVQSTYEVVTTAMQAVEPSSRLTIAEPGLPR
jgi:acyl carrier protein